MKSRLLLKLLISISLLIHPLIADSYDDPWYDSTAYTECKWKPEAPLYNGGILNGLSEEIERGYIDHETGTYSPAYVLQNLTQDTKYSFSCWIKIEGADSALIKARLSTYNSTVKCIGSVLAKSGCWSFLKGGFVPHSFSNISLLFFQNTDKTVIQISVASASLQPFTDQQWTAHQLDNIRTVEAQNLYLLFLLLFWCSN